MAGLAGTGFPVAHWEGPAKGMNYGRSCGGDELREGICGLQAEHSVRFAGITFLLTLPFTLLLLFSLALAAGQAYLGPSSSSFFITDGPD